jgi:hypothetical protein
MGGACSTDGRNKIFFNLSENRNRKTCFGNLVVDRRIILKFALKEENREMPTGLNCCRIKWTDGILRSRRHLSGFTERREFFLQLNNYKLLQKNGKGKGIEAP